ncbi:hypothetical protein A2W14_02065 [Candidatus Gottesmanbacteria bacterium RBG_16_37_8]|uniref:Cell shape-determining protein MreC n=1 Tax=Candidatus Gottesmanbacteria bacterium RBG_16_37_8 TaxID=1798371 RepID=A0A1F5YS92_9BACT|nr:MAG: hypothetical protein A2W14_02065 [Candidatus Gottesmanbacteria bacterium RBG_16_37_8]
MRRKFFILLTLSILLFFLDRIRMIDLLRQPAEPLIISVKTAIYQGFFQLRLLPNILINYTSIISDINKNRQLTSEYDSMKLRIVELEEENQSLRKQLGAPYPPSFSFIPADVIAVSRFMEINIGSQNGVKIGMPVVDGLTLIGRISQTTNRRSLVLLLTDTELQIPAISSRGARGKVVGQLGNLILFKSILQKDPLFLEDIVLTSGEEGFPPKLLIGKVTHINTDDVAVYKEALLSPYAQFDLVKKVFVIDQT